jgi:hypothetical protein
MCSIMPYINITLHSTCCLFMIALVLLANNIHVLMFGLFICILTKVIFNYYSKCIWTPFEYTPHYVSAIDVFSSYLNIDKKLDTSTIEDIFITFTLTLYLFKIFLICTLFYYRHSSISRWITKYL